jgi:orotidine-5'-phosphate decarboxylase
MNTFPGPRIIVALDYPDPEPALTFVGQLKPSQCRLKVGFELFTRSGPAIVEHLVGRGFDVFLDLKFHDIPTTVAKSCAAAANLGVWMLNVHTLGGRRMLVSAREALESGTKRPLLIGVTVLTSHGAGDLAEIGIPFSTEAQATKLAGLASQCGLDGVVCSAQEASLLRASHGDQFCLVTPGIRPLGSAHGDQERVVTPLAAVQQGANYIVIGRPITQSPDPVTVINRINDEIAHS